MELFALTLFLAGTIAPFGVPFLVVVASPNRWAYVASVIVTPLALLLALDFFMRSDPGPAGAAILFLVPMAASGWLLGALFWLAEIWRSNGKVPRGWSIVLYGLAALLLAALVYPWPWA